MFRKQLAVVLALGLFAAFINPGCAAKSSLDKNLDLWRSKGIKDYSYELQVICFCPAELTSPVRVEVRNSATLSVRYVADNAPAANEFFGRFDSVEKLFDVIRDACDRGADSVSTTYDPANGSPASANIDYIKQAVDEELAFTTRNFRVLSN
jgi:hypothetical protein